MATELARMPAKQTLQSRFADKFEIDPANVMSIVATTVFKQGNNEPPLTPDEVQAAMIVCNQYDLNPFLKEIYAFRSKGKLLIYVSVDGWCKVVNRQEQLDGIEFVEHFNEKTGLISAVTCRIFRKDRRLPIVVTEYYQECMRDTEPWKKSPVRMTRHRSLIQCARVAFSISGIMDEDDAENIQGSPVPSTTPNGAVIDLSFPSSAKVTQDQAREFGKAWKASGFTIAEAKENLKRICGVEASLDIPVDKFEEAMRWATKNPNGGTAAPEPSPDEKICRGLFGILQYDLAKQAAVIDESKGDWCALALKLNKELPVD